MPERAAKAQRQDSVTEQLRDVIALAEREGCYDAADWIKTRLNETFGQQFDRLMGSVSNVRFVTLPEWEDE